uniref:Integrase catalytic domain-containing protein n=1 Tax=Heterorhabditis bacteriophora TaxID=37862 RepID=A0A1I7WZN9_HETBA
MNFVEGFHSKIRASYPTGIPSLDKMLKFCAVKLTMGKTLTISLDNGSLKDHYIWPYDEVSQRNMLDTMANFQQHIVQLDENRPFFN